MKILFLARRYSYYRNYDSVIRKLAARGLKMSDEIRALLEQQHSL